MVGLVETGMSVVEVGKNSDTQMYFGFVINFTVVSIVCQSHTFNITYGTAYIILPSVHKCK